MIVYPNAKINIGLNVVEKRPDGYHNLETVFYPIGLQDILEIQEIDTDAPACGYRLKVTGTVLDGSPEDNLVVRALKLLKKDFDLPTVSIGLYKHIPTGAGLGGGSADGAFTVKTLNERFKLGLTTQQMEDYCSQLGADCPFFIQNKPMFATGIGAYGANRLNDHTLADRTVECLMGSKYREINVDDYSPKIVRNAGNCERLEEIPWISTNHVAQYGLNAIMVMEFINV